MLTVAKKGKKKLNSGRPSSIKHHEEVLMSWLFLLREIGIPVSIKALILKASHIDPAFGELAYSTRYQVVRRLCHANCLSLRRGTHQSQGHPQEAVDLALQWITTIRPIVSEATRPKKVILNMDQTAVFFSLTPRTTLNLSGERTINVTKTASAAHRATVAVTVSADGDMLDPMIIFRGTVDGRIATRELPTIAQATNTVATCQQNGWMDAEQMFHWVDTILRRYLQENGANVEPLLFLDSYSVHKKAEVVTAIEALGCKVRYIPPGCTGLVQPVDVGIGKPFKDRLTHRWEQHIIGQGVDTATFMAPSRGEMAQWVADELKDISRATVQNSWRSSGFNYFPEDVE